MDPSKPESSGTTKKWLIGCGIGCGAVILIVGLLIVGGVLFVKDMVKGFEESEALLKTLTETYGPVDEYIPEPDGELRAGRLEKFLEVRAAMRPVVEKLEQDFLYLADKRGTGDEDDSRGAGVLDKLRAGFGLVPKLAEFLTARNQGLLDAGMGLGEYYHIYTLAYYSWLRKPLMDGPPLNLSGDESGFRFQDWDEGDDEEMRRDMIRRRLHRMLLAILQNQRDKLNSAGIEVSEDWRRALESEIAAMEADRYRLVWQDGLPDVITKSLEPFRSRLETSYSPMINSLELTMGQR